MGSEAHWNFIFVLNVTHFKTGIVIPYLSHQATWTSQDAGVFHAEPILWNNIFSRVQKINHHENPHKLSLGHHGVCERLPLWAPETAPRVGLNVIGAVEGAGAVGPGESLALAVALQYYAQIVNFNNLSF